jgi:hypothetical protein
MAVGTLGAVPTADDLPHDAPWPDDDWDDQARPLARRPLWFKVAAWSTVIGLAAFVMLQVLTVFR